MRTFANAIVSAQRKTPRRSFSRMILATAGICGLVAWTCPVASAASQLPRPLPGHPGNVYVAGERIFVPLPAGAAATWRVVGYDGKPVAAGSASLGPIDLGILPVGWYELVRGDDSAPLTNRTSLAVLAPLGAGTPATSPVSLDVAMAWFYPPEQMPAVANLCALAGINWARDRLSWSELEPQRGRFNGPNRYDRAAAAQAAAGLRHLQVIHLSPAWANPETKRFPLNLRDGYNFYREMARRWRGRTLAFEPWNEADVDTFGGHTGSEIAALQKAAWLGLKAGNPRIIACQNVFAVNQPAILEDFAANRAWPYFDTLNLHHYVRFDEYPRWYADFRAVSAGKPLWVTECNVPVKWSGDERVKEPSPADLKAQAERVAKVFASSLHERAAEVFYFLLPHYVEGQTQFGILRPDLTPRPAYAALAAVGRLLADARPLGRSRVNDSAVRAYWFNARPEGWRREVVVAWVTNGYARLDLPRAPRRVFDHLGRACAAGGKETILSSAPQFFVLPAGSSQNASLARPPNPATLRKGRPSPVVLQAWWPTAGIELRDSAYRIQAGKTETIPVRSYNFSNEPAYGHLQVQSPPGWRVDFPGDLSLAPQRDSQVMLFVTSPSGASAAGRVTITGDFGSAGQAVLSVRLKPQAGTAR